MPTPSFSDQGHSPSAFDQGCQGRPPSPVEQARSPSPASTVFSESACSETYTRAQTPSQYYAFEILAGLPSTDSPLLDAGLGNTGRRDRLSWEVKGIEVHDSYPCFCIEFGPLVWDVAEVWKADNDAFNDFCRSFQQWDRLFASTYDVDAVQHASSASLDLVPGDLRGLRILDTLLDLSGKWVMLVNLKMLVDLRTIRSRDDQLLQAALVFVKTRGVRDGMLFCGG